MGNTDTLFSNIDYSQLMDLRVDFAFKLLFSKGDPRLLVSLLNAVFANKKIPRVIKSLTIKNPFLDKESLDDKLSILDVRAELEDGTAVLIEMHLYGLGELKSKTIRSWARAYGEELEAGENYADQPPTIVIAFANGKVKSYSSIRPSELDKDKIHKLCMIMDCEDYTVFTDAMELHYIDMKAFAEAVNKAGSIKVGDTAEVMFAKWLSIITQREIENKDIIKDACESEEEIFMAVSALVRHGEDKIMRQAYQRRQDEIYYFNKRNFELEQANRRAEQERREKEQALQEKEQERHRAEQALQEKEQAEMEIERLRQELAQLKSQRT